MKRILMLALAAALCLLPVAALAGEVNPVKVLGVTAITETMEEGEKLVALAVEYSEPFEAGEAVRASFAVEGRDVSRVYVNQSGRKGDVAAEGRFILVELATSNVPGSSVGTTLYFGRMNDVPVKINHRLPVAPLFTQAADLTAKTGGTAVAQRLYVTKEVNELADQFQAFSFADPETGVVVNYRLFIPEGYEAADRDALPLVVFLHGSGERGYNNASQLLANRGAIEWATPEAQKAHPCFVLAPQNPDVTQGWAVNVGTAEAQNWVATDALKAVRKLIDQVAGEYPIDANRIYGTGLSQGSKGIMRLSIDDPDLFAAQVNVAGCDVYTDEEVARIAHKPIWHLIAVDDATNPSANVRTLIAQLEKGGATVVRDVDENAWNAWLRGADSAALADALREEAAAAGANVLHTEYIAATVVPNTHWSWMASYSNESVREWLFSAVRVPPNADL